MGGVGSFAEEEEMSPDLVRAEDIEPGEWFVKSKGTFAYLRLSESAVNFLGLDPQYVYGIAFTGNVSKVRAGTPVRPATIRDHLRNVVDRHRHEESVGCTEFSREASEESAALKAMGSHKKRRRTVITIIEDVE